MDGKKVIVILFAAVILVGVITFALYLATRQEDYDPDATDETSPAAVRVIELRDSLPPEALVG